MVIAGGRVFESDGVAEFAESKSGESPAAPSGCPGAALRRLQHQIEARRHSPRRHLMKQNHVLGMTGNSVEESQAMLLTNAPPTGDSAGSYSRWSPLTCNSSGSPPQHLEPSVESTGALPRNRPSPEIRSIVPLPRCRRPPVLLAAGRRSLRVINALVASTGPPTAIPLRPATPASRAPPCRCYDADKRAHRAGNCKSPRLSMIRRQWLVAV